ncbi:MAG: hypothetical protein ABJC04_05180 [Verrucomicrobiota bacterium]
MKKTSWINYFRTGSTFAGLALVALLLSCPIAQGQILYRETFGTDPLGTQGPGTNYNWAIFTGTTAADHSTDTNAFAAISIGGFGGSKPGTNDPIGQVNAGPVIGSIPAAYGVGFAFAVNAAGNAFLWTPEYPITSGTGAGINPNAYPKLRFKWFQGNANTDGSWRVAVRIGGVWYASQTAFLNNAPVNGGVNFFRGDDNGEGESSHGAELKSFIYTTNATAWFVLNFDGTYNATTRVSASGTVLSLGAQPAANLSGNIDAFGLFSDAPGSGGNRRFDAYTIEVPRLHITTVTPSDTDVVISGVDGTEGGNYYVIVSSDLTVPLTSWTPIATNVFDLDGKFSFTSPITPGIPQQFYSVRVP